MIIITFTVASDLTSSQLTTELESQVDQYNNQSNLIDYWLYNDFNYFSEPKMWDLIKIVIPKIKADWKHFAYSLEYDIATVKAIERNSRDSQQCCENLFEDWLTTENSAFPKTWSTLLQKIRQVDGLFTAADDIKRELSNKK